MPKVISFTVEISANRTRFYQSGGGRTSVTCELYDGEVLKDERRKIRDFLVQEVNKDADQSLQKALSMTPDEQKVEAPQVTPVTPAQALSQGPDLSKAKDECCRKCGVPVKVIYRGPGTKPDIFDPDGSGLHFKSCVSRPGNQGGYRQ